MLESAFSGTSGESHRFFVSCGTSPGLLLLLELSGTPSSRRGATGIAPAASLFDCELPSATMSTTTQLGDASIAAASTSDITDGSVCVSGSGETPRQGTERPAREPLGWISILATESVQVQA